MTSRSTGEKAKPMSMLAIRFVKWVAAISIAITLVAIALATYLEYRDDVRGIREQLDSVATFVPTLSTSVWRLDDSQIEIQLQGIVQLPAVLAAAVVVDDQVAYQQPADAGPVSDRAVDVEYPLVYESDGGRHELGTLAVTADHSYATARVPIRFLEIASIQGVRGLFVAAVFFWVFSHLVGSRLKRLSADIGALNWENLQNQPIPMEPRHEDELSQVRNTIEAMRIKIVEGIQREQEAQAELRFRRLFDPVTGLPNRTLMTDRLETLRRSGANSPLAVVAIELLRLSEIDYMLDSPTMNQALGEVAEALKQRAGAGGLLSRYSERRFVLAAGPVHGRAEADQLVSDLAAIFEQPYLTPAGESIYFSAAYGIALAEEDDEEIDAARMMSRAVLALDSAAPRGDGSRAHWGEHLRHGIASIYQEIRQALSQSAFDLHCQPIFDIRSRSVQSMECLLRWHSPRLESYGVQGSIHLLERSGMSSVLDRTVLDSALALRQRLRDVYSGPIAINLTAASLSDSAFAEHIGRQDRDLLEGLELELTETNVLHDVATAQKLAEQCRDQGIRLVLDDFGTGFSSIEYLSQFQFHAIKIDRSFLRSGLNNQHRLLHSMVSIAHGVDSIAVAEGIETEWQLGLARELEVDCGQGYLYSKPLSESETRDFMQADRVAT